MAAVHFLNVGAGDCTIIEHPSGRITMIDINNGDDLSDREVEEITSGRDNSFSLSMQVALRGLSGIRRIEALKDIGIDVELTNPIEFLHQHYPGKSIFRYVQSHPDLDHMRGLSALLNSGIKIWNFWDCPHNKAPDFSNDADREDWQAYLELSSGRYGATVIRPTRGFVQKYYNQNDDGTPGGDGLHILSPSREFHADCREAEDTNNSSYVLLFKYRNISVILGGDAEEKAWDEIHAIYGQNWLPACTVLKASHHGRDSGYHQQAVKAMNPAYTIISAGKKPDTEVCAKYSQYCKKVWTTRWMGNIHVNIPDEGQPHIFTDRDA